MLPQRCESAPGRKKLRCECQLIIGMFVPSDGPSRPAKSRRTCPFAWEPRSIEGQRSENFLKHSETASSDLTDLDSSWSSSPPRTASSTPVPNSSLVNSSRASPSISRASPSPSIGSHLENIHLAADDDVLYVNAHLVSAPKSAPTTPASASRAAVPKATPPADKPRRPSSRLGLSLDGTPRGDSGTLECAETRILLEVRGRDGRRPVAHGILLAYLWVRGLAL